MKRKLIAQHSIDSTASHIDLLSQEIAVLQGTLDSRFDTDTIDVTVRFPDFEAKIAGKKKNEFIESLSFVFQDFRFSLLVYPKGDFASAEGNAAVFLRKKDDYTGSLETLRE
uniref:Uncharacterized protein n=1 Tax=Chromera velia CCMP2878 TaxID=1169474 RepID=A0A0G4F044_9ALVE|eukprot:Cvel_14375.t1-p1 / transcript=Cvel_14375.t1 / gene=Cvel_14375 / organism=Chromera_velia_CCMP2878 / gene_product=hypothetical protein / transcript_product=hypothetical protein / location=Cvel_scaffold1020:28372-29005(-) / protein_length=111 / sequence_SO=supercontig / SO=protein_coding / is_pseudo=false